MYNNNRHIKQVVIILNVDYAKTMTKFIKIKLQILKCDLLPGSQIWSLT